MALQLADDEPQGRNVQTRGTPFNRLCFVTLPSPKGLSQHHLESVQSEIPTQLASVVVCTPSNTIKSNEILEIQLNS